MAYMPLDKSKLYLETEKMTKIWDLSQPWGWDTPCGPSPAHVLTCSSPAASTSSVSTREPAPTPVLSTLLPTAMLPTTPSTRKRLIASVTATPSLRCPWSTLSAPALSLT